jgi:hypothetical protein
MGASSSAAAAHDEGVVRTIGAGFTGAFHALDLLVAAPALILPLGTRALRAGLAGAVITAICGVIAFDLARELVALAVPAALNRMGLRGGAPKSASSPKEGALPASSGAISPRLVSAVAAVAVLTALLSPAWQSEAVAPGTAVTGVLLVLLALRLAPRAGQEASLALVLGLAASYEPLVFLAALGAAGPSLAGVAWSARAERRAIDRGRALKVACAFALGLLPLALGLALARRAPEIALDVPMLALFERAGVPTTLSAFAASEIGALAVLACAAGAALSLHGARSRAIPSLLVVGVGVLAVMLHVPAGPHRFAAPVLAGIASAYILGATTLGAVVLAIARMRVPLAEASAALLVVLELVLPVKAIDETTVRREGRVAHATAIWNDVAWGAAPPAAVVLVADRGTMRRVASTRAAGAMRGDLVVVPTFDVQGRAAQRALAGEPKLAPLYRDVALGLPPEELSLAQLGAQRAVLATFDPKWDRALSRHFVSVGLSSRFEPEPRGASDRKRALEAFLPARDRLLRVAVAKKDPELAAATAVLLRARAIGMAAAGERELLARALDDLRVFAPDDEVGATLVRRTLTSRGAIDVHDLGR